MKKTLKLHLEDDLNIFPMLLLVGLKASYIFKNQCPSLLFSGDRYEEDLIFWPDRQTKRPKK